MGEVASSKKENSALYCSRQRGAATQRTGDENIERENGRSFFIMLLYIDVDCAASSAVARTLFLYQYELLRKNRRQVDTIGTAPVWLTLTCSTVWLPKTM